MKRVAALAIIATMIASAQAADVGVSISISQPGVYGRIDIGRFPQPALVVAQPVLIAPALVQVQPVYLWVPPGHRKNWRRHCGEYQACGVPVYFVQEGWYRQHVMQPERYDNERGHERRGQGEHDRDHERGRERGREGEGRGEGHGGGRGD